MNKTSGAGVEDLQPVVSIVLIFNPQTMNVQIISPAEMSSIHFAHHEVLREVEEQQIRNAKLRKAMLISHLEHQEIGIVFQLDNGEIRETYSSVVDYADDFVEVEGGHFIPVMAIMDVEA